MRVATCQRQRAECAKAPRTFRGARPGASCIVLPGVFVHRHIPRRVAVPAPQAAVPFAEGVALPSKNPSPKSKKKLQKKFKKISKKIQKKFQKNFKNFFHEKKTFLDKGTFPLCTQGQNKVDSRFVTPMARCEFSTFFLLESGTGFAPSPLPPI